MAKTTRWLTRMLEPCNADKFIYLLEIFQSAADQKMVMENFTNKPILEHDNKIYSFKDIPINRGMLAVAKELHDMNIRGGENIINRIMEFGQLFEQFDTTQHIKKENGKTLISDALIKAYCQVPLIAKSPKDLMSINFLAIQKLADQFILDEDANNA